jgi:effector-binding domain-containing protein
MEYQINLIHVDPLTTGVIRCTAKQSELSVVVPRCCGEVWTFFRAAGLPRPGRHLAVYLDGVINLEVVVEVDQPFTGNDRVVYSTTPSGMVATAVHMGPYNRLHDAHQAIVKWCADNGHVPAGPNWEIYGHWSDDPAQLRTDVYYLL